MSLTSLQFPDPASVPIIRHEGKRRYQTPDGIFPGVTTVISEALGLGKQGLIRWSANEERKAVVAAAQTVYERLRDGGLMYPGKGFEQAILEEIGPQREHQKKLAKAGDIGGKAHEKVQWHTRKLLGLPVGPEPKLADESEWAVMAWQDWWMQSELKPILCEQPVYSAEMGVAGTVDLFAYDKLGRLGIIDYKTSKSVYPDHHIQVAAYCHMSRQWGDVQWARLIKLPKNVDDPGFEVHDLGEMTEWDYSSQCVVPAGVLTEEALVEAFMGALVVWQTFCDQTSESARKLEQQLEHLKAALTPEAL